MTGNVWKFAVDVYARPGVETACLALQEQGADVCLLLVAAWLGRRGVSCSKERAQILENAARPWRETVIEPLRRLRCAWREAATHDACLAELREEMKAQELRAEREHLQRLADLATAWLEGQEANRSADAWLQVCSRDICTEAERRALLVLGSAALQTAP
ncbi:TPA: TIGR02444 family protein [Pseudomonas aeruginosa]